MNKKILGSAIVMAFAAAGVSTSASAALATNANLSFTACTLNSAGYCNASGGSYFGMDASGDGIVKASERTSISSLNGINIGTAQSASGTHNGLPTGLETSDNIDNAWGFFKNTGMHQTTVPVTIVSQGAGTAVLDFSGWNVTWNTIPSINMGSTAWNGNVNGQANMTCSSANCAVGDTYVLNYSATVPVGDLSGFGGVPYLLHLEGIVGAGAVVPPNPIPVPAAAWLFGSGLLGLAGIARRRKTA